MSQLMLLITPNTLPPTALQSFVTDNGTVIPDVGVVNINGGLTDVDNANGIRAIANPTGSKNLVLQLTNTIVGTVTTTDATPTQIVLRNLGGVAGTYLAQGNIVAHNTTDGFGASYGFSGAAYTTGMAATEIGSEEKEIFEQAGMATCDFNWETTGNSMALNVVGIAGKTIKWYTKIVYTFVG